MKVNHNQHVFSSPTFQGAVDDAVKFLASTPTHKLPPPESFSGIGVYALYYIGNFHLYTSIAEKNRKGNLQPIYVGKAVPTGWRTARVRDGKQAKLHQRLREHARSIGAAQNLELEDFSCRFIILGGIEADLVTSIEAELIRRFTPLWNCTIDGFGNHDPGSGRYNQAKSEWDVLHPGRQWADNLTGLSPDLEKITLKVKKVLPESGLS